MTVHPLTPAERAEVLRLLALEPEPMDEPSAVEEFAMPWYVEVLLWACVSGLGGALLAAILSAILAAILSAIVG